MIELDELMLLLESRRTFVESCVENRSEYQDTDSYPYLGITTQEGRRWRMVRQGADWCVGDSQEYAALVSALGTGREKANAACLPTNIVQVIKGG